MLGFGTRNQNFGRDAELAAVEFLAFRDVLRGLSLRALVQVAAVMDPFHLAQFLLWMREEIDAFAANGMGKQDFGGEARNGNSGVGKDLRALMKSCLNGHGRIRLTSAGGK